MPEPAFGIVYAVTGADYVTLARRSARALRLAMPAVPIDLFTDAEVQDPTFDRVVPLERRSRRPKMEALRRSRFERTLFLDADTIALAPLDAVFEGLDRFDIALVQVHRRADARNLFQLPEFPVPESFPALNSGVVAVRRSPATEAFLAEWEARVHDGTQNYDQAVLRALLYRSDLRLLVLPPEYNVMWVGVSLPDHRGFAAPRLLHLPRLHEMPPGDPLQPLQAAEVLPPEQAQRLEKKLAEDPSLQVHAGIGTGPFLPPERGVRVRLRRLWRRARQRPI